MKYSQININQFFDKIFYINLNDNIDRDANILNNFMEYKIYNYERVEGVKVTSLPDDLFYRNFIYKDHNYILGSLGCRESHLKCIKIAKANNYKRILILEDDVTINTDFNQILKNNYNILFDWDMIYFGGLIEQHFRGQIVGAYAYALHQCLFDDIIYMCETSGMEIDNFYAKIIQQMSCNKNLSGKYSIKTIEPFNFVSHDNLFNSNIKL
jgi:GR25 family glycosyltransferase involved in LPS biosynthesis